jgi:cytochrome c553
MRVFLRVVLLVVVGLVFVVGAALAWSSSAASRTMARTVDTHQVDFPIPFPLEPAEVEELGLSPEEAERLALERAIERGRHLAEARYGCGECHGENMGGGTMIDAFPIGTILGPNLTLGEGGPTRDYTPADWDRIVRHGVRRDGRMALMPSEDFVRMSDQELSDLVAYIRSFPPVDATVPEPRLGPLGRFLVARGEIVLSADLLASHDEPHATFPPPTEVTVAFGAHLGAVCTGCHAMELSGGRIAGGDPSWPPAANLTPHEEGLAGWDYGDFVRAMREGVRPDGGELRDPMRWVMPAANNMTEVEMEALWLYLTTLEARPTGG